MLSSMYYSLVYSHPTYGIISWGRAGKTAFKSQKEAMSKPNGLLSQTLRHYNLNQGRTLNDIVMRAAH